jgi:DNA-binding transcriptional regulator PaaX
MPQAKTEGQQRIVEAVAKLGDQATFAGLVAMLAKKGLTQGQVRGAVVNCAKHGLIKKGADDVYRLIKRRAKASRPKQRERHRRPSIVVAAQEMAARAVRRAEAAQHMADILAEFPDLRDELLTALRKRQRS